MKRVLIASITLIFLSNLTPVRGLEQGALKLPPFKKVILKNGLTLLLMEQHEVPIVSFNFLMKSGGVSDPSNKEGLASLTADLLRKGTKTRTSQQISTELDFVGGQLRTNISYDFSSVGAEFLKKDLAKGIDLLGDVLLNPTFPQDEVDKLLKQRIDEVRSAKDQPLAVLGTYYNSFLFGSHPYGRSLDGDEKSLAAISREDVIGFYGSHYTPGNGILAIVGDFTSAELERTLEARFAGWAAKQNPQTRLQEPAPAKGKKLLLVDKPDSTQTFYRIGNVGISRTNPDRVYVLVVNTLFGGRFTSMLNSELRINSGLTYGARSSFDMLKVSGPFSIVSFTQNSTTEKALDLTLDILKRLHEKGITEEELKSAKEYVKGQFPPTIETTDQLAGLLVTLEFYGLNENEINNYYTKIESMTLADANRVIKQYFPIENLVFVLIGKSSEIQSAVKKYAATVSTKSISEPGF